MTDEITDDFESVDAPETSLDEPVELAEGGVEAESADDPQAAGDNADVVAGDSDDLDLSWAPAAASSDDEAVVAPAVSPIETGAAPSNKNKIWLFAGIGVLAVVAIVVAVALLSKGGGGLFQDNKDVAARVNGEVITIKQLDAEIAKIKMQNPTILDTANGGMEEGSVRKTLLDELVNRLLVQQDAEKEGVKVDDKEVQTQLDSIKSGYEDDAKFDEALKGAGYTLDTLTEQIRYNLYLQGVITKKVPDDSISDEEVKKYYEENKASYVEAAGKKASHILFGADDKAKAQQVLADLKKSTNLEKDFAEAAKADSTDTATAQNGGDLGWPTSPYVEEFEKALDKLDVNEMSNLVKTQYGYHIILVTDKREESTKAFEDVKAQIQDQLLNTKRNEAYQKLLEDLKKAAKIEILDPAIVAYDKKQEETKDAAPAQGDGQAPATAPQSSGDGQAPEQAPQESDGGGAPEGEAAPPASETPEQAQ